LHTTVRRSWTALRRERRRQLTVVSTPDGEARGLAIPLSGGEVIVGRGAGGPGAIMDPALSRRHYRVRAPDGDRLELEDLGGANGTFVDGAPITRPVPLQGNEVIWAGDTVFVVEVEPPEEGLLVAHDTDGERASAFLGPSLYADRIRRALETAATAHGSVLVLGPSGAGKEVSAQILHTASGRPGPFVPVNCAAIPSELAESELFGHERGAFTGADRSKRGHFEAADGGTLFLDEIGELPATLQSKLLRVLETGVVQPVGGKPVTVDVRVVAATNRDVHDAGEGFRGDLLARLSDWLIRLPPLAARRADILPLFASFTRTARGLDADPETTPLFDVALVLHDWPFNVRELEKLAGRVARLSQPEHALDLDDLPPALRSRLLDAPTEVSAPQRTASEDATLAPSRSPVAVPSRDELTEALRIHRGNIKQMARANGWHRMQIYRWMEKHALDPGDFR